jgi:hypothetical protein
MGTMTLTDRSTSSGGSWQELLTDRSLGPSVSTQTKKNAKLETRTLNRVVLIVLSL